MTSRHAVTSQPLHPLLATRYSTRAFDPSGKVTDAQVTALLEAARWAPSSGNTQPSRFIVGRRDSPVFARVLATLRPGNQQWARHAALLLVAVRVTANAKGPLPHAAYDLGQAMAHLVVQAQAEGLTVRQMAGFSPSAVTEEFGLAEELVPTTVAAIGVAGDPAALPDDLRGPDDNPRRRKPLDELILAELQVRVRRFLGVAQPQRPGGAGALRVAAGGVDRRGHELPGDHSRAVVWWTVSIRGHGFHADHVSLGVLAVCYAITVAQLNPHAARPIASAGTDHNTVTVPYRLEISPRGRGQRHRNLNPRNTHVRDA